jgi:hypothetical protein
MGRMGVVDDVAEQGAEQAVVDDGLPGFNVENRFQALEHSVLQSEADAKNAKETLERRLLQSEAYAEKAKVDAQKAKEALERRLLKSEANAKKAKVVAEKRSIEDTKRVLALESKLKQERASAQVTQGSDATKTNLAAKPAPTNAEARLEELERKLLQSEVNTKRAMEDARKQFETVKAQLMKQHLIAWEDDNDGSRLPGQWVNIRIFLSSSFVDTQAERDVIIKNIIPRLNFNLQGCYIRVVAVDLRWGQAGRLKRTSGVKLREVVAP